MNELDEYQAEIDYLTDSIKVLVNKEGKTLEEHRELVDLQRRYAYLTEEARDKF